MLCCCLTHQSGGLQLLVEAGLHRHEVHLTDTAQAVLDDRAHDLLGALHRAEEGDGLWLALLHVAHPSRAVGAEDWDLGVGEDYGSHEYGCGSDICGGSKHSDGRRGYSSGAGRLLPRLAAPLLVSDRGNEMEGGRMEISIKHEVGL